METLLIYIAKSSGLMAGFYLLYYFLLRRDTFFTVSRWYLLGGLLVSLSLPLLEIKKTVIVPQTQLTVEDLIALSQAEELAAVGAVSASVAEKINWFEIGFYGYILMTGILFGIVILNLISLWRLLHRQQSQRQEKFVMVDLDKDVAPFSFFRYIVFNSRLYSRSELESIINHEKVHSEQHHTFDILLVRLVCIIFWFNPFVWVYRKAIAQNLEYIADQQAVKRCNDRKAYQIALLRAGACSNTISITNPFFQSLIKKRIVMLNKEQSKRSNLLKYALVLPFITAFMLSFQVRVIAQAPDAPAAPNAGNPPEVPAAPATPKAPSPGPNQSARIIGIRQGIPVVISKKSTDSQLKSTIAQLKKEGITLKVSKVKRNKQGEITEIKLETTDKTGNKSVTQVKGNKAIKPISVHTRDGRVSYSATGNHQASDDSDMSFTLADTDFDFATAFNFSFDGEDIAVEVPTVPKAPSVSDGSPAVPAVPDAPPAPRTSKTVIIKNAGSLLSGKAGKPMIIIDGQVAEDHDRTLKALNPDMIKSVTVYRDGETIKKYGDQAKDGVIMINTENAEGSIDIKAIQSSAMKIAGEAMQFSRREMRGNAEEMEQAKAEMAKAKEELIQAKKEIEAVRAELEKARRESKKP